MSDVVATIILLGITVTLFASLFAFVDSFPPPPSQSVNTFQTSLSYITVSGKAYVASVSILLTAGPSVASGANVYLGSENNPRLPSFLNPITVGYGINNASSWGAGQSWFYSFPSASRPPLPDNITVSIVQASVLLYSVVLPGNVLNLPPSIAQSGMTPSSAAVGAAFQIYASFSGNVSGGTPTVSLGGIPGLSGSPAMSKSSGLYVYNVSTGRTTTAGTYYAFIGLTNSQGQQVSGAVTVVLTSSGGGGGGGGGGNATGVTVDVGMSPEPPTTLQIPATYFWATVTYSGSLQNVPVSVNFTVTQVPGGRSTNRLETNTTIPGQTGFDIDGPSTVTIYSQSNLTSAQWLALLNTSVSVTATATLGMSVGTATGSVLFSRQNLVQGIVYVTTSNTGLTSGDTRSFPHNCGTPGHPACPFLYTDVWNNYTAVLFGSPPSITFSGVEWANSSTNSYTLNVASQTVNPGASKLLQLNAGGGWNQITVAGTYAVQLWLTIKSSAAGTPTIGYIFDVYNNVVVT